MTNEEIVRQVIQEVLGSCLGDVQMLLLLGVAVAQRKAVNAPALATGPGRAFCIALAAVFTDDSAGIYIVVNDVTGRAVGTDVVTDGLFGMGSCHMAVAHHFGLPLRPVQKRNVHHAVDDGKALTRNALPNLVPSLNKTACAVEACHQSVSRTQRHLAAVFIAGDLIVQAIGDVPHEAHIVIHLHGVQQRRLQKLHGALCKAQIGFVAGGIVHQQQHGVVEAVRPPIPTLFGHVDVLAVFIQHVGQHGLFIYRTQLFIQLCPGGLRPLLLFRFEVHSIPPKVLCLYHSRCCAAWQ